MDLKTARLEHGLMGCDYHVTCKDCRITYYCGYGSATTWVVSDSIEGFIDELHRPDKQYNPYYKVRMWKNRNVLAALALHHGHNVKYWSSDWAFHDNEGNLVTDGGYFGDRALVDNEKEFAQVNLEEE